jgi:hypothetical protein
VKKTGSFNLYTYKAAVGEMVTLDSPEGAVFAVNGAPLLGQTSSSGREIFSFSVPAGRAHVSAFFPHTLDPQQTHLKISGSNSGDTYSVFIQPNEQHIFTFDTDDPGPS